MDLGTTQPQAMAPAGSTSRAAIAFELAATRRMLHRADCGSGVLGAVSARHIDDDGREWVLATSMQYGDEATTDSVVAVPLETADLPAGLSPAIAVQQAIYRARPNVSAIVHTHSHHVAVHSSTGRSIGMYNEMATLYHEVQAFAEDDGDRSPAGCDRLVQALGNQRVLMLKGHGVIAVASSVADAAIDAIALERSARWDLEATPYGGAEILPAHLDQIKPMYEEYFRKNMWVANLRRLRRSDPDLFASNAVGS